MTFDNDLWEQRLPKIKIQTITYHDREMVDDEFVDQLILQQNTNRGPGLRCLKLKLIIEDSGAFEWDDPCITRLLSISKAYNIHIVFVTYKPEPDDLLLGTPHKVQYGGHEFTYIRDMPEIMRLTGKDPEDIMQHLSSDLAVDSRFDVEFGLYVLKKRLTRREINESVAKIYPLPPI